MGLLAFIFRLSVKSFAKFHNYDCKQSPNLNWASNKFKIPAIHLYLHPKMDIGLYLNLIGFTSMDSGALLPNFFQFLFFFFLPRRYVVPDEKHSLRDTHLYFPLLTNFSIYFTQWCLRN